ncbi:MAG: MFS transporter [Candidatus Thorarchaeota archaeon]
MSPPLEDEALADIHPVRQVGHLSGREKVTLYGVSLGYQVGQSMIFSFLSYYGVSLGAKPIEQSILVSTRNLGSNIFQTVWGRLADRIGRKPLVILGLIVLALCTISAVAIVRSPLELVFVSLCLTIFGFMFIPAWNALLGDYSDHTSRGTFIGRISSFGTYLSVPVIIAVGLTMDAFFQGPKSKDLGAYWVPFGLSCTMFLVATGIAVFLNERYTRQSSSEPSTTKDLTMFQLVKKNQPFSRLLTIDAIFKFSMSLAWPVFPYVAMGVAESWLELSFLWAVFNFPRAVGQAYGGKGADRFGKKEVLLLSRTLYFTVPVCYFLGLLVDAYIFLFLGGITGGIALGGEEVSLISYSLDCSTDDTKATYYSILLFTEGWIMFSGSIIAGITMSILQALGMNFNAVLLLMLAIISFLRLVFAVLHSFLYPNPTPPILETKSVAA